MREKVVTRIRELLQEATPAAKQSPPAESLAAQAFQRFQDHDAHGYMLDQSHRARTYREIVRLATAYGWQGEVDKALDAAKGMSLSSLGDQELEALLQRLRRLEDCLHTGIGSPDSPPAY